MNIFDMYQKMQGQQTDPFAMGQGGGLGGYTPSAPQQPPQNPGLMGMDGLTQNMALDPGVDMSNDPQMPKKPKVMPEYGDPSGFANYGMTSPELPDAAGAIAKLMGMAGDPHAQAKLDPQQQPQGGALMQYLQSLGV